MKDKIYEFRCLIENALLAKCNAESVIEIKCKKCKFKSYFLYGTSYLEDRNNQFQKGED